MNLNTPYPTWLEINLAAVERNVKNIIETTGSDLMAVVKGNAYGHGTVEIGKAALAGGAKWLAAARVCEALELRQAGVEAPILVLGLPPSCEVDTAILNNLTLPLPGFEAAEIFSQRAKELGKTLNVHLKVDTGMGRLGVLPEDILPLARKALELGGIKLDGLFSHFAAADQDNSPMMQTQLQNFKKALQSLDEANLRPQWVHMANTGASLAFPESRFSLVRGGQSIMGLNPFTYTSLPKVLEPALTAWKARLISCKELPAGWGVGYGPEYVTKTKELIGAVSVGFGDGVRRVFTNEVLIDGQRVPVRGAVCMDQIMIALPKAYPLDTEVVLIGTQGNETISIEDVAARYGVVHVDFLMGITQRVPRVYYRD